MKIDVLTLFPNMFKGFKEESIIKRAIETNKVTINTCNFRDFSKNKHKKVDDTPYGGGNGMVLMCQPIFDAVESLKQNNSKVILLSPQGTPYNQDKAYELSKEEHLILICGHYEGFDERIRTICDEEISIGDYVLTGGEIPAMVICDSVTRLLPGVIEEQSHKQDSFNNNLLDYPTYTKPRNYKGMQVPEVLLSGNHKEIDKWRHNEKLKVTKEKRPDLLKSKVSIKKQGPKNIKNKIYLDDIKDIKVKKYKEINKTGKYVIYKTNDTKAITILNIKNVKGYKLKSRENKKYTNRILIVKPKFIKDLVMRNISKKLNLLRYKFNITLMNDDDEETGKVLGEAEMLKSFIISAYSKYLGAENLDMIIKNINMLVNEFVKAKSLKNTLTSAKNNDLGTRRR